MINDNLTDWSSGYVCIMPYKISCYEINIWPNMTDFKTFPTPTRYWRLKSTKLRVVNFQFDIDFRKIILIEFPDITGSNNIHCKLIAFHHSGSGLLFSNKWKWLLYAVFIWVQLRRIWIIPFNLHALPFRKQVNTIGRVSLIKSMNNERKMGREVCVFIPCSNCRNTSLYISQIKIFGVWDDTSMYRLGLCMWIWYKSKSIS